MTKSFSNISSQGNYIGGQFRRPLQPQGNFEKISPADFTDHLGVYEWGLGEIDLAVESAHKALANWSQIGFEGRRKYLLNLQSVFKKNREVLAQVLARDVGKAHWECLTEIDALSAKIDITLSDGVRDTQEVWFENLVGPGSRGGWKYKPLGVVAVLGPFNFPAHLPNGHWVPALIMGNTVVFKPSEFAPTIAQFIAECFDEAGFPEGVFNLVHGARDMGEALVVHPKVQGIFFTGSYAAGRAIKSATLNFPQKLLALEMGGKNTTVILEDARLDLALSESLQSAFLTSGQRCSATSRIFIHENLFETFLEKFVNLTRGLEVGYPFDNPFMGSLIHEKSQLHYLNVCGELERRRNYQLVVKPELAKSQGKKGYYVRPSVSAFRVEDWNEILQDDFLKEEIFAPHVTVVPFRKNSEAIAAVNATPYGLVASIFTSSSSQFDDFFNQVECGLINWNRGTIGASSKLPFGGIKRSGNYFPSAAFASRYTGYPVSMIQNPESVFQAPQVPGINWRF